MFFLLADNQDITRAGLAYVLGGMNASFQPVTDKAGLIEQLKNNAQAAVFIDYTLFDINDADELIILSLRFPEVRWILFSDELSSDFIRRVVVSSSMVSVVMKDSPMNEIRDCIKAVIAQQRYICQQATEQLIAPAAIPTERFNLTKTETEILKDIALGLTTKEIAERRFSSFHTVNTHRKNIFRKLNVNNAHEATKYALRAGLVDAAEYYI
ncbi:MAG: response regulator transcription factor [Prevotella sp.]|nr:response regulator transcription factor [Prevotella sp.]